MDYKIRKLKSAEYPLLEHFLYQAIFVPEGVQPPPNSILDSPELRVYLDGFGTQRADLGLGAEADGKMIGAVWSRIMEDYGHIDDQTPSLAISLDREYRGLGIGTAMMQAMLALLARRGYARCSLAVQKKNYAFRMYQKLGFEPVRETREEYIMVKCLSSVPL